MIEGTMTALVTPFRDGQVDAAQLRRNVEAQVEAGIDALVPCGTTGESPTLSHEEHRQVIETVVETAAGRTKVIAGTGSNATSEALELTRHAQRVGADAALMVNPYYNKPTQEGLYRHFATVAEAVELDILLYNIPGRTGVALAPATIARLAGHERIVGVKEATGSLDVASEIYAATDPDSFSIVSGDDSLTLPLMAVGGRGVISVVANLLPERVRAMVSAAAGGDFAAAREIHYELFPLFKACLSLATNPITIKTALAHCGRDTGEMRLPLCAMEAAAARELEAILGRMDLSAAGSA